MAIAPREQQRFVHLVLGEPRPRALSVGRGKAKRHLVVALAPGIEERVQLREDFGHRQGTPETHGHVARYQPGAIARLHHSRAIDDEQLASARMIVEAAERLGADVAVRTASLEARVDTNRYGDGSFYEALGAVWMEMAYSRWRALVSQRANLALVSAVIIGDVGLAIAARRHGVHHRSARSMLQWALTMWPETLGEVRRDIDPATLAAAQAGVL